MAIKFNEINFDLSHIITIVAIVGAFYTFKNDTNEKFRLVDKKLDLIISNFELKDFKTNTRIDNLSHSTPHKTKPYKPELLAIFRDNDLKLKDDK